MPTLAGGARLGPYEILDAMGAGGMGEVYRGRDTRLDRIVAIKVLAPGLAKDITSRERFEREAKAISSLNHPNICVLHDIGREKPSGSDEPAVDFLVMEYLEGETLNARLARGRLGVDKALAIAIPIAAALDCAHRQGIVHRDLKPGNVMLLSNGAVKLLDFGLARLAQTSGDKKDSVGHGMVSLADLSLPTVSSPLTITGTILGTLQYMAPEQLEGKEVDARADIFAFGGMLYEMLTGKRPFDGKSQASLIGAILDHQPPPVTSSQPLCPPIVDEIVRRCLEKNPDDRWQTARDLKRQLEWVAANATGSGAMPAGFAPTRISARRLALVTVAIVLTAGMAGGGVAWSLRPSAGASAAIARFSLELPEDQQLTRTGRHAVALSPDGAQLVYVANQQLYLRRMNDLVVKVIDGTEGSDPTEPAFSPDGQWIAFWSNGELKKVPAGGGRAIALAKTGNPFGMSWEGERILLGLSAPRGIVEVPANGGDVRLIVPVDANNGEYAHYPTLVGGGRAVMFTHRTGGGRWDDALVVVQDLTTGVRTTVFQGGTDGRVTPSGHLVYVREATLFAAPFDTSRLVVTSNAVPVLDGISQSQAAEVSSGAAQFAIAPTGTLVFVPGGQVGGDRELIWVNRQGKVERASAHRRPYSFLSTGLRISPDGSKVALTIDGRVQSSSQTSSDAGTDIWIWDIARDVLSPLTFTGRTVGPVWTPDGKRVCYRQAVEAVCQSADGSGQPRTLMKLDPAGSIRSFSPDGRHLLSVLGRGESASTDILMTTLASPPVTEPLLQSRFGETAPAISPDGRWVAYQSNQSGRGEIYVRPFPDVSQGYWGVSTGGGAEPRWSRDGRTLFFISGSAGGTQYEVSMVRVEPGATFVSGKPAIIARVSAGVSAAYDVAPDGRLLFHEPPDLLSARDSRPSIVWVQNWFEELRARVPNTRR